jgi:hypothetical protein
MCRATAANCVPHARTATAMVFLNSVSPCAAKIYRKSVSYIQQNTNAKGVCVKVHVNPEVLEQLKAKETIFFDAKQKVGVKLSFMADTTFIWSTIGLRIPHKRITGRWKTS